MNCHDIEERITPYLLGDLEPGQAESVKAHLEACESCRALAQELESTLGLLHGALAADTLVAPTRLDPKRRRRIRHGKLPDPLYWFVQHGRVLANAAVILVCVGLLTIFLLPQQSGRDRAGTERVMEVALVQPESAELEQFEEKSTHWNKRQDALHREMLSVDEIPPPPPPEEPALEMAGLDVIDNIEAPLVMKGLYSGRSSRGGALAVDGKASAVDGPESGGDFFFAGEPVLAKKMSERVTAGYVVRDESGVIDSYATVAKPQPATKLVGKNEITAATTPASKSVARNYGEGVTDYDHATGQIGGPDKNGPASKVPVLGDIPVLGSLFADMDGDKKDAGLGRGLKHEGGEGFGGGAGIASGNARASGQMQRDDVNLPFGTTGESFDMASVDDSRRGEYRGKLRAIEWGAEDLGRDTKKMPAKPAPPAIASRFGYKRHGAEKVAEESKEKMVPLKTDLPRPLFVGTPTPLFGRERRLNEEGQKSAEERRRAASELGLTRSTGTEIRRYDEEVASDTTYTVQAGDSLSSIALRADTSVEQLASLNRLEDPNKIRAGQTLAISGVALAPADAGGDLVSYAETPAEVSEASVLEQLGETDGERDLGTETKAEAPSDDYSWEGREDDEESRPSVFKASGFNPYVETATLPFSTFSIDVDTAAYTLARKYILAGRRPPAEAVRTEEFVNAFDHAYRAPEQGVFGIAFEAAPTPFGEGHLLKIGVKGKRLGREEQRAAVLTFVIDTSGSMNTPDRLGLVKRSLHLLVNELAPQDRVALVQYGSQSRLLLAHTPAAKAATIHEAIKSLQASGSTHLEEGLRLGYEIADKAFTSGAANRVLLLSDGMANLGSDSAETILEQVGAYRKQGLYCSIFGFGIGNYNDPMLETLANKGDGVYHFIDSLDEAKRVFVDDLGATLNVIAGDVKIQVEFDPQRVKQYRQLGYENRQLTKEQFRDDTVDAGEVGSGQSVTALYEVSLQGNRDRPLGIVRIRYRDAATGQIEEIERPLTATSVRGRFEDASVRFRLAACVAEFAEILRGSPFAAGSDLNEVARALRPTTLELHLDAQVQELLQLVGATPGR